MLRYVLENLNESKKETELVIYAKIGDQSGLLKADVKETQEQYEIKSKQIIGSNQGCVRVRKTITPETTTWILTTKNRNNSNGLSIADEHDLEINEEMFNSFKAICPNKTLKDRFIFNSKNVVINDVIPITVPLIKYEVDCVEVRSGEYFEWCKIDIELDDIQDFLSKSGHPSIETFNLTMKISHLPFKPLEWFIAEDATAKQELILDNFYQNYFNIKQ